MAKRYYKIIDGERVYFPGYIEDNGVVWTKPSEARILADGWLVEEVPDPEPAPLLEPDSRDVERALKRLALPQLVEMTDEEALEYEVCYPTWYSRIGMEAVVGERLWYDNGLYKCRQAHTISEAWNPKDTPALWANVSEESQEADGSREHPYQWEQGMTAYEGKYYTENNTLYLCTRDSGNPLYFPISSLIGTYFQIAE